MSRGGTITLPKNCDNQGRHPTYCFTSQTIGLVFAACVGVDVLEIELDYQSQHKLDYTELLTVFIIPAFTRLKMISSIETVEFTPVSDWL